MTDDKFISTERLVGALQILPTCVSEQRRSLLRPNNKYCTPEGDQRRLDPYYKTNQHHDPPSLLWQRVRDRDWIFIPWLL